VELPSRYCPLVQAGLGSTSMHVIEFVQGAVAHGDTPGGSCP
jgi:hypothetical protein